MNLNLPAKTFIALCLGVGICLPATADIIESSSAKLGLQLQRLGVDVELAHICQIPNERQLALNNAYAEMLSTFSLIARDKSLTAEQKREFGSLEDAKKRFVSGEQSAVSMNQGSTGPTCIALRRDWDKIEANWTRYAEGIKVLKTRYYESNK